MINCLDAQTYAVLYCRYDSQSGHRNWKKLLQNYQVESIDLEVARKAAKSGETSTEIQKIIYFGSPQSQLFKDVDERLDYSFKIAALALFPRLINHQQQDLLLVVLNLLKSNLNDDVLIQILEASSVPINSKQVVSILDQIVELINL